MRKRDISICVCGEIKHKAAKLCRKCYYESPKVNYVNLKDLTHRECLDCKKVKVSEDMMKNSSGTISSRCIVCYKLYRAKKHQDRKPNVDKKRKGHIKRMCKADSFGIKDVDSFIVYYDSVFNCELCGSNITIGERNKCIDHCHATGEFRGILCRSCNLGLGYFRDRKELLEKAILYLEKAELGTNVWIN